jgi:hypothetical protein
MLICDQCRKPVPAHASWCPTCGPDDVATQALEDMRSRERLRAGESAFNNALIARASAQGGAISSIAPDGCEVTAFPNGTIFYDSADWY